MQPLKMDESVSGVENIIGYTFTEPTVLWEALQAPGSGVTWCGERTISTEGNKRMALLGDAWLKLVIIDQWFREDLPRGDGDLRQKALASNENLMKVCVNYGLDKFIRQNPSTGGIVPPRTRADTIEAILGAVGEEGGMDAVRLVVKNLGLLTT